MQVEEEKKDEATIMFQKINAAYQARRPPAVAFLCCAFYVACGQWVLLQAGCWAPSLPVAAVGMVLHFAADAAQIRLPAQSTGVAFTAQLGGAG